MSKTTIGITIGPIYDTISNATKPAGVWFASYFFSNLTELLCNKIVSTFQNADIISPNYENGSQNSTENRNFIEKRLEEKTSGIGKYHDRIFFTTDDFCEDKLNELIREAKRESSSFFVPELDDDVHKNFLDSYLQIHYIVDSIDEMGDEKNCILGLSSYLDALELMKTFPADSKNNPFEDLFFNSAANKNIKGTKLFNTVSLINNQLLKPSNSQENDINIKSVEDIAACIHYENANVIKEAEKRESLKRFTYYAVVQADADNMTTFLKNIENEKNEIESLKNLSSIEKINAKIKEFSERCLRYDEEAAKIIGEMGGMTIYAGGDDLLFFAPVINKGKTIFEICNEIQTVFHNKMLGIVQGEEDKNVKEGDGYFDLKTIPTISFGISIHHVKQPLSDALKSAYELLMKAKTKEKNKIAVKLQKHSGATYSFEISNRYNLSEQSNSETKMELNNIINDLLKACKYDKTKANVLQNIPVSSVIKTLLTNQTMLLFLIHKYKTKIVGNEEKDLKSFQSIWQNLFDNPNQTMIKGQIDQLAEVFYKWKVTPKRLDKFESKELERETKQDLEEFINILQWIKFLDEKQGEGEDE